MEAVLRPFVLLVGVLVIHTLVQGSLAKTTEEWKSRVIYQLLTDRFGPTGESPGTKCEDLRSYCGGTFTGIRQRLDYIQGLGANAIWISPFVENTEGGYHGYWAKNIYRVNPHFGTEQDLKDLVQACHDRDIWVMMDVIANHMGPTVGSPFNFTDYVPFNETWHYHDFCTIHDWLNQTEVELCRLAKLPDLNQSVPLVRDLLLAWIRDVTHNYGFDGYRVDTAVEVPKWFWEEFSASAGVYLVGEANNGDRTNYTASYQGPLPGVLNFPLYWAMRKVFNERQPMTVLADSLKLQREVFEDVSSLGLFVDNHDFPRFLNLTPDTQMLRNALAYVMFGEGIPIVYYGTEQGFHGGNDPEDRESLWPFQSSSSALYRYIASLANVRAWGVVDYASRNQRELFVDSDVMVFARGGNPGILVALTNVGGEADPVERNITGLRYQDGTTLQNALNAGDSLSVTNGTLRLLLTNGAPKVYRVGAVPSGPSGNGAPSLRTQPSFLLFWGVSFLALCSLALAGHAIVERTFA